MDKNNFQKHDYFSFSNKLLYNILNNWILISAGNLTKYNMMTASWATFGILWNKPIAQVFIRPSRYTYDFIDENEFFSICFFNDSYKDILALLGSKSGKNFNKMKIQGLNPIDYENKTIYFEQSEQVLILKKIYKTKFDGNDIDKDVKSLFYPDNKDFHFIFYGQIVNYLTK